MTLTIPTWLLWTLAGLIGVPALTALCFFAFLGWACTRAFHPFRR